MLKCMENLSPLALRYNAFQQICNTCGHCTLKLLSKICESLKKFPKKTTTTALQLYVISVSGVYTAITMYTMT